MNHFHLLLPKTKRGFCRSRYQGKHLIQRYRFEVRFCQATTTVRKVLDKARKDTSRYSVTLRRVTKQYDPDIGYGVRRNVIEQMLPRMPKNLACWEVVSSST
ncbi:hypothetical protein NPIL_499361 [Nephila pilipes]|uniref:Uncharacterized protein n=1 Tax=Nephila pilipes TaxID=299642 RepID=A0A8X6QKP5_NEPPI|nr:hypothetical protein NPIL_499361 [Nephila pilipes]